MKILSIILSLLMIFTFAFLRGEVVREPAPTVQMKRNLPTRCSIFYEGIRPDQVGGRDPLVNPERGWRWELILKAKDLTNPFKAEESKPIKQIIQEEENLSKVSRCVAGF